MKQLPVSTPRTTIADTNDLSQSNAVKVTKALIVLTKPRLAFFSVLTAMAAYGASLTHINFIHALITLLGTSLAAGGALSLNHWWEKDSDALMSRTCNRPLPKHEISPALALTWSLALSVSGVLLLLLKVNAWAAGFAAATILLYGLLYTPLKSRTRWATEVGSISGALPPLLGSAAAGDVLSGPGITLFLVLLFWQMPHFYAIGWMYRSDYQAAGFPLLPAVDPDGKRTAAWSIFYTALLLIVSLIPCLLGWLGLLYGAVAALGGAWFLWKAIRFLKAARNPDIDTADLRPTARQLFLASVKYLPAILVAMVLDRLL